MSDINQNIPDSNVVSGVETITKKRKAPIIAGVTAGVVAVGAGGGVIAYNTSDFVKNQVKLATLSPSEYYSWVHEDGVKNFAKDVSSDYKTLADMLSGNSKESLLSDFSVTFNAGEDTKAALEEYISDAPDDVKNILDNFNSVKFNINSANDKTNTSASASLSLNDESLVTVESLFDAEGLDAFFRIPELSEKYLGFSIGEFVENNLDSEASDIYNEISDKIQNPESVISESELEDLITRYANIWFESVEDVELEKKEEVEIGDITAEYTTLTVEIDGDFLCDVVANYVEEITKDKLIKKIACDRLEICDEDEYDEMMDELSDSIDEDSFEEMFDEMGINGEYVTYVDAKGVIRGISFSAENEENDETLDAQFIIGKEDDKLCGIASLNIDGDQIIDGVLNADIDKNDAYTGEASLIIEENEDNEISVEFDKFKVVNEEKGYVSGDVTLNIPEISPLEFKLESDGKSQVIGFDINIKDKDIGSLEIEYSVNNNKESIEMPSDDEVFYVDLNDLENGDFDYTEYISNDDITAFITDLCKKIGLDDETAEIAAGSIFEAIDEEINGSYDYGYNDWDYDDDDWYTDDDDWDDSDYNWDDD